MKVYLVVYSQDFNQYNVYEEYVTVLGVFSSREKAEASEFMQGEHDNEIEEHEVL